jgi:hypothetical protein
MLVGFRYREIKSSQTPILTTKQSILVLMVPFNNKNLI